MREGSNANINGEETMYVNGLNGHGVNISKKRLETTPYKHL